MPAEKIHVFLWNTSCSTHHSDFRVWPKEVGKTTLMEMLLWHHRFYPVPRDCHCLIGIVFHTWRVQEPIDDLVGRWQCRNEGGCAGIKRCLGYTVWRVGSKTLNMGVKVMPDDVPELCLRKPRVPLAVCAEVIYDENVSCQSRKIS